MRIKIAFGIFSALLLLGLLLLGINVPHAKAWTGTVQILADGSVNPPSAPIAKNGNVYTLTDNIMSTSDGLTVEINGVTVDGQGHMIQGSLSGNGIDLTGTSGVTITNANVNGFSLGIVLASTLQDVISGSNVSGNQINGVMLSSSDYNTISGNNIQQNSASGIWIDSSSNNNISDNTLQQNSAYGIWLSSSSNNIIYNNNFIDNTQQVYTTYDSSNIWNQNYPTSGNYWKDYIGLDCYQGPFQNVTGCDGIADLPYVIDQNNLDNLPLTKPYPWAAHNIGITYVGRTSQAQFPSVSPLKNAIGLSLKMQINVFVMNYGGQTEVFTVTTYVNRTVIGTTSVTLAAKDSTVLNFNWNTTGLAVGNYTINANATDVPGETDTADNIFAGGRVALTIPGDVNGDFKVSLIDLVYLANAYGTAPASGGIPGVAHAWNTNADIDDNGVVGLTDLVYLALHYGQHYP